MSARNYYTLSENGMGKLLNCLPNINHQKPGNRSRQELPPLSGNAGNFFNRNLNYSYDLQPYVLDNEDRAGTPFSDFFSESETDTPDFRSEESDSSAGSALCRSTAEATKILAQEWDRIERTLYDEEGEKCTRPHIIEECKQWKQLHPHLRIVGKAIQLSEKRLSCRQFECDEVFAMHYSDYEKFSESEERLSQSSTDVTPQNSPRASVEDLHEPKLMREKLLYPVNNEYIELPDSFCSLLQITPIQIHSPLHRKRQSLKPEVTSSRWMRGSRPDSSVNCDRNSAKSFASWDTRNHGNTLSASERIAFMNSRVVTAKHRDLKRLEPLCSPGMTQNDVSNLLSGNSYQYGVRKVSLPPLLLDERKKVASVSSAKKYSIKTKKGAKCLFQLDKVKHN